MAENKVILILDDEPAILDSVKYQVQKKFGFEFEYELATNGQEGLEIVDELLKEGLDMLVTISDWLMPGMNGDEFLIELHKRIPNCVKIMLTGQADSKSIEKAYKQANLYKVIYKPWSSDLMLKTIEEGIKKHYPS
ncbi:MAG: response regulator [Bacteroidota bacterium]